MSSDLPALAPVQQLQEEHGLTELQARFVHEYPASKFNAAEAARRAGYSENTAREIGHENLTKPHIQAALSDYLDGLSERAEIRAEDVLEEYRRIAFSGLRDVVRWGPDGMELVPSEELPPEVSAAVKEVEVNEWHNQDGTKRRKTKVKMHSKGAALDKLGQYLQLWKDPNEMRMQILQVFNQMSPEELEQIEQMEDGQLMELMEEHGVFRLQDGG